MIDSTERDSLREEVREYLEKLQKKVEYTEDVLGDIALDLEKGHFTISLEQIRCYLNCALAGFELVLGSYEWWRISPRKDPEADDDE